MEIVVELPGPSSPDYPLPDSPGSSGTVPHHYNSTSHSRVLLSQLGSLRSEEKFCDVVLVVEGTRIPCHRLILAAWSNYFKVMFTTEMTESRNFEVKMHGIECSILEILVNFCYCGEITITETNVQLLLPAACLLQICEIQEVCCDYLKLQLSETNCLGIRQFADTHACKELLKSADRYTLQNFSGVMNTEEFLMLPLNQLIDILSSEDLNVRTEETVFTAAIQWIRYDLKQRRQHLSKVLEHVRLPLCHPKFIVSIVSEESLIKSDQVCRNLVDEAKNYLLLPLERSNMQGPRTRPRKPVKYREVLYAVGGWCSGDAIASVEVLDPSRHIPVWTCVASMSKRRCGVGVAALDGYLYAVGGHDGTSYLNSVERYDPATNQWDSQVAPTSTCRTSVGIAVLNGLIFAIGGQDGNNTLNIVEWYQPEFNLVLFSYDPRSNMWSSVASMNSRRLGVSVAVLNNYIYAIGGSSDGHPLDSVERYDSRAGRWENVKSMGTRRKHLGSAVYDGQIYAVGGRDHSTELNTAEKYNPYTNEWSPVVAMNKRRSGVGLAVVDDRMFAIGGFDGQTYLKDVEVFDKESNLWKHYGSMNYRRLGGGVASLSVSPYSADAVLFGDNYAARPPPGII